MQGCSCKKGCKTSRCSCKKKGERCNEGCGCKNCQNINSTDLDMVDDEFEEIFGSDDEVYEDINEEVAEVNDDDDDDDTFFYYYNKFFNNTVVSMHSH